MNEWILAALLHFAPIGQWDNSHWRDDSADSTMVRYRGIASAIESACEELGRSNRSCYALGVAIAVGESGLARDADEGPCYRKGNWWRRCDAGKAASVWQAHAFGRDARKRGNGQPVTLARLFAERDLAAWQALRVAYGSLARCRDLPAEDRLSGLSGRCQSGDGVWRARWRLWSTLQSWSPDAARR